MKSVCVCAWRWFQLTMFPCSHVAMTWGTYRKLHVLTDCTWKCTTFIAVCWQMLAKYNTTIPYRYWSIPFNGNFRTLKWRYRTIWGFFCSDIPLHSPYMGLIYDRYLQFRFLKKPLISIHVMGDEDPQRPATDSFEVNRRIQRLGLGDNWAVQFSINVGLMSFVIR